MSLRLLYLHQLLRLLLLRSLREVCCWWCYGHAGVPLPDHAHFATTYRVSSSVSAMPFFGESLTAPSTAISVAVLREKCCVGGGGGGWAGAAVATWPAAAVAAI